MKEYDKKYSYMQNRELSWLRFNERVLDEADDISVPLYERLKFVSIFSSNLDEFFMIRVGSLTDMEKVASQSVDEKSGMTASQQLECIYDYAHELYGKKKRVYSEINMLLRSCGMMITSYDDLRKKARKYADEFFFNEVAPILSPQIIDGHHPFPHMLNKNIYICATLTRKNKTLLSLTPIPQDLPDVLVIPGKAASCVPIEQIMMAHMDQIFDSYQVVNAASVCITRNADVSPDDESFDFGDDFREIMKKTISRRRRMEPVRLECTPGLPQEAEEFLCRRLSISCEKVFHTDVPMKLSFVFAIEDELKKNLSQTLFYEELKQHSPAWCRTGIPVMKQVQKKDLLLAYPFESMDVFLRMLYEAANDPAVISIKITIYRLSSTARIVDYLCMAAENGKDVTTMIELRARFDEQNNIEWSRRLEDAGCTILFGFDEYKVHSKICLITRRERGKLRYITQVGTGNYNEKTAKQYTDLALITASPDIGRDAGAFFKNMAIGKLGGEYSGILAAPVFLKKTIIELIDRERLKGSAGLITIKINSITDIDIIKALRDASAAGARVRMIVRGISCLLPDVAGETENIEIVSIVGRYLEHSRIYCFGRGDDESIYISSADFMTRNTERRVELACPVRGEESRKKIHVILEACLHDTQKARRLCNDGSYIRISGAEHKDSQKCLSEWVASEDEGGDESDAAYGNRFGNWMSGLRARLNR